MPWYSYALITAVCIATVGLLEKKVLQREHSLEYVAVFSVIKLGMFLLFFTSTIQWAVTGGQFFMLAVNGAIGAVAFLMIAKAMRRMEISSAVPILALDPGLTALLALLFLGERLTGLQITGLLLLVTGTYILEIHREHDQLGRVMPKHWSTLLTPVRRLGQEPGGPYILLGLLLFSLASVLDRYLLVRVPVNTYIGYSLIISTAIYLFLLLRSRRTLQILRPGKGYLFFFIALAAALHLTSTISQARAVSLAAVALVIGVKRLSVLIDVILGGRFFHEHNLPQKILASIIMLIGVYCVISK